MTEFAAASSHVGKIRSENQDSGYAGTHLFAVADGMGGHAGGDVASAIVAQRIRGCDGEYSSAAEAGEALAAGLQAGNDALQDAMREHPELAGMGTTFSGIIQVKDQLAVAHIGDSRIYRYRVGALTQITTDHTFVQRLVDAGRITREEAEHHPRRNVVMRVLGNIETHPEIDVFVEDAYPDDRWLICSDGLSSYVPEDRISHILELGLDTSATVRRLVNEALSYGAPDNVTVVLVDIVEDRPTSIEPILIGSAENEISFEAVEPERTQITLRQLLMHPRQLRTQPYWEYFEPESDEVLQEILAELRRQRTRRRVTWTVGAVLTVVAVAIASIGFYNWTQTRYYIAENEAGYVAVYQGIQQDIGPISLSTEVETTEIVVDELPWTSRNAVRNTLNADDLNHAEQIIDRLEGSQ
ncbi:PP2C family protein-serine/threonine phosphatase [Agrococcus casei]|uniref:Protein serine/threonine phosphatase PrpC, regulation of stationary phase n=1 Tax=Agrococcus casei LMG 22410 TaxID=1255656 RepID=A0A1R4EPY6_9MICO|nr:protein phosphatase 2C domain-containing protein [Agrococcus casei]SJM45685.1 Protein serine/threonine phosphatase PrpC, regulation of stationary phase [Agrococcus casei LMG 22410]